MRASITIATMCVQAACKAMAASISFLVAGHSGGALQMMKGHIDKCVRDRAQRGLQLITPDLVSRSR
jgi:hypothetical protein